jgi:hypothetical protein
MLLQQSTQQLHVGGALEFSWDSSSIGYTCVLAAASAAQAA